MNKSILQDEKSCFITGRTTGLHKHHIYGNAGNRPISEEQGFWVWLSHEYHTNSNECVHKNHPFNLTLKKMCQFAYEAKCVIDQGISWESARDRFMKMIGRNFL